MDHLLRHQCKGVALTTLAAACLRRVLTRTVSQIVGDGDGDNHLEETLHYESLKRRVATVLPPDLAQSSLAYAKKLARTTRPPTLVPNASKTANIVLYLVLEYLLREVLELAQLAAARHRRILPRHVRIAILGDDDLKWLVPKRTVLFFPDDDKVDPLMGRLGNLKFTQHCLSTVVPRTKGECSLDTDDEAVGSLRGPFRMYSRIYKDRVVAFLMLSKTQQNDENKPWRLDYGFHLKCRGVWQRMVQRLLFFTKTIVVPVVTSSDVQTFLTSVGFREKKSGLWYNADNETQNHEIRTHRALAGPPGVRRHVRGRDRDDHAASPPGSPRGATASPDRTSIVPPCPRAPRRSPTHEGHVPGRDHL